MQEFELIENYLFGRLSGDVLKDFEKRRQTDEDFAFQVELHKMEHASMSLLDEERIRSKMREWRKDANTSTGNQRPDGQVRPMRRFAMWQLLAAACVALLIGIFIGGDRSGLLYGPPSGSGGPLTGLNSNNSLVRHLIDDGLVVPGEKFVLSLTPRNMRINGRKQSDRVHRKYLRVYEQMMGFPLTTEFRVRYQPPD